METLGRRIARLRREKELKQEDLAAKLDVSGQAVSKWENDQTCPDITALPKLADILGVTVDELLTGKKEETVPAVRLLPPAERKHINDMILRIIVDSSGGDKVRVNLPMGIIPLALEMGIDLPQISGISGLDNINLKSIDLNKIMQLVHQGFVGNLVEVESSDGDSIRIFVE